MKRAAVIKSFKVAGIAVVSLAGVVALYLGCEWCLSRIGVNRHPAAGDDVTVYLFTNGVHTDIVVPVSCGGCDWHSMIFDTRGKDIEARYAAFGWGDKGFYLDTPTWADLTFGTAFRAAFWLSTSAMHVTFYRAMDPSRDDCVAINIDKRQYEQLTHYISDSFQRDKDGNAILVQTDAQYGQNDAFYEGVGRYNLFFTCNTWANNALKACGQRACLWTASDTGIFYQYKNLYK